MDSNDGDLLAAALRKAKGLPRSSRPKNTSNSSSSSNHNHRTSSKRTSVSFASSSSRTSKSRSNSPKFNTSSRTANNGGTSSGVGYRNTRNARTGKSTRNNRDSQHLVPQIMKTCSFCDSQAAAICINKSISKTKVPLCLVHYYTTRSCRIDPKKLSVISQDEMKAQLPYVQDLFSQAFTELQSEIATESARSFNEMASRGSDPLSILHDVHRSSSSNTKPKIVRGQMSINGRARKVSSKDGNANDGGFMSHVQQKEVHLEQQQKQRTFEANSNISDKQGPRKKKVSALNNEVNPYKRRKMSGMSSWNQVLDDSIRFVPDGDNSCTDLTGIFKGKCSCGGDAIMFGNTTSRNNDVPKAEIWGTKQEKEVSIRFQCKKCAKIWNEDE